MKLEAKLTPVGSGSDRRSPGAAGGGGGGSCSGRLVPGEVIGSVVSLTQWTPPPMVEGVFVWWQPVFILDPWVSVCGQHLHTRAAWKHLDWPGKVLNLFFCFHLPSCFALKCRVQGKLCNCMHQHVHTVILK